MELLVKLLHIGFMSFWLGGAIYLPQVFWRHGRSEEAEAKVVLALARGVYLYVMSAGGIAAVVLGTVLVFFGVEGGWLPVKLALVLLLIAYHLFCGRTLLRLEKQRPPHRPAFYHALTVVPLILLPAIVALAVVKPF